MCIRKCHRPPLTWRWVANGRHFNFGWTLFDHYHIPLHFLIPTSMRISKVDPFSAKQTSGKCCENVSSGTGVPVCHISIPPAHTPALLCCSALVLSCKHAPEVFFSLPSSPSGQSHRSKVLRHHPEDFQRHVQPTSRVAAAQRMGRPSRMVPLAWNLNFQCCGVDSLPSLSALCSLWSWFAKRPSPPVTVHWVRARPCVASWNASPQGFSCQVGITFFTASSGLNPRL